ncbi:MAG: OmpA family protein [Alphaproteobacteria bacterium]|nr:OmpA family protein [Alphaproteobacteria bacterium]
MPFMSSARPPNSRSSDQRWQNTYRNGKPVEIVLVRVAKRKRIKKALSGHGAWKVAYADFATAMMAFFMLLWMLVATTPVQKEGLSSYFDPQVASHSLTSGSGGTLGGRSVTSSGSQLALKSPVSAVDKTNLLQDKNKTRGDSASYLMLEGRNSKNNVVLPKVALDDTGKQAKKVALTTEQKQSIAAQLEEAEFVQAEQELRQAIQSVPELSELRRNLVMDRTAEGFRIQIVDQEQTAMFPLGSSVFSEAGKKLMQQITQVTQKMPNRIAITGHTDGNPFRRDDGYSNWELSSDRANASRRALIDYGMPPDRIASVVGKADTELLNPSDPLSPLNRRISFVLLRSQKSSASEGGAIPITVQ